MICHALPPTAVVRVSRGPARFAEIERMTRETGTYLVPAIKRFPGLLGYFTGASPSGSSQWEEDETKANQMGQLKEMIVKARRDAEGMGVSFIGVTNYPIAWSI